MILCCGEALIDMIPNADGAFMPHPGGAVFNTAIGLGRQGVDVGLLSGVSTDLFGDVLECALQDSKVATDHLIRSDRPTTLAFVKLVDGKAEYAFYDENTAGRLITAEDLPRTLPDQIRALFFGGISLAVEPCADTYLTFLNQHADTKLIMVDPNIRPGFIVDEARYRERMKQVLGKAHIIKISDEDLTWLDPSQSGLEDKARALLGAKTGLVCLTKGSEGVTAFRADGSTCEVASPKVDVVDTVGAGDAFNAGLLTVLSREDALSVKALENLSGAQLSSALHFAVGFASDTVKRPGSDPAWSYKA